MLKNLLLGVFVAGAISACSTGSGNSSKPLGATVVGDVKVEWRRFDISNETVPGYSNVIFLFSGVNTKKPGDAGYVGCYPAMKNYKSCVKSQGGISLTRAQTIRLAEQVIAASPNCRWQGFDDGFDRRTRATGALASISDTRMLFGRVACS